jgi:hypothetical protein
MSVYGPLADRFGLNALQRHATRRDRDELAWHNRVQFARRRLVDLGYLDGSERGLWGLTPAGRAEADRLASEPEVITLADLLELGL